MKRIYFLIFFLVLYKVFAIEVEIKEIPVSITFPEYAKEDPRIVLSGSREQVMEAWRKINNYYRENKFVYKIDYFNLNDLGNCIDITMFSSELQTIYEENNLLREADFLKVLNQEGSFKIFTKNIFSDYEPSYQKLRIGDRYIGETLIQYSREENLYPTSLQHVIIFIRNGYLVRVIYSLNDIDSKLAPQMRDFFEYQRGAWRFEVDPDVFFQKLFNEDESLPAELITFQRDWKRILLSIKNCIYKNEQLIIGFLNDSQVRIRTFPNLLGEHIGYLYKDQTVQILDQTENLMKIGEMESVWYKIRTEDGTEGWVYGFFIDIED